ncbi:MAG: prepilin-type N-terminal cleavage/methylation domain-containing protein [Planctomycetota bacterium]|nr:prepilin-type N-terminal cleavage/methylation domain-containing protein [Planctomycetota bacterium]
MLRQVAVSRNGVTLLEILLVVAVIAILSALAFPLWSVMLQSETVSRGADILRAELGSTRVNAIREGEEYVFCYVPDTGQFWNEPLSASTNFVAEISGDAPGDKVALPPSNYLPQGVVFAAGESQESVRSLQAEEEDGTASNCNRIIFYPDGTAQTSGIIIKNEYGDAIQVTLRGITGGTSSSGWLDIE